MDLSGWLEEELPAEILEIGEDEDDDGKLSDDEEVDDWDDDWDDDDEDEDDEDDDEDDDEEWDEFDDDDDLFG